MPAGLISMGPMQWTNGAELATRNLALAGQMAASMDKKINQTTTKTEESGGGGIGGALGSAIGGIAGGFFGPAGAMIGSSLGGALGGAIDGGGAGAAGGALTGLSSSLSGGAANYATAAGGIADLFSNSGVEQSVGSSMYNFAKNASTGDAVKLKYSPMGAVGALGLV